jgi:hypothetical protein
MNPTKAAAIIALIVTIGAVGYLAYQATAVRSKYDADVADYEHCKAGRRDATANWDDVQSHVELFKAQGKYKEAADYLKQHEGERPLFIGECGQFLDMRGPTYAWPAGITVIGLITSLALFGAANPTQ